MAKGVQVKIPQAVRNAAISAVVILLIMVGAGAAYVWYNGQSTDHNLATTAQPVAAPAAEPMLAPPKPSPTTVVGASVQSATSPVTPGSNTSVTVRTVPQATCTIAFVYNGVTSKDSGLAVKTADEYGMVTWVWTIGADVPLGTWPANITCEYNKKSGFVRADIVVAKTAVPTE